MSLRFTFADSAGPVAIATVMGGEATSVSASTTDIILESAYFQYDSQGRSTVTCQDVNRNDAIDYAGTDRISENIQTFATRTDGATYDVQRTTRRVWDTDNADAPFTVSMADTSTDGLRSWSESGGIISRSVRTIGVAGAYTETSIAPISKKGLSFNFKERPVL